MDSNNKKPDIIEDAKDEIDDILEKALEGADDKLNLTADESIDEGQYDSFIDYDNITILKRNWHLNSKKNIKSL